MNGSRVFARIAGPIDAPSALLVHGLGVSSRYMIPLIRELASDFRVYAPDLPGFGKSDKPPAALTIPQLGEVLDAFIRTLGLTPAVVIGNSMGCQIIVEVATAIPAAVLLGPTMDATARHQLAHMWRLFKDQFREPPSLVPLQAFDYLGNGPFRTMQQFRHALAHDMLGRIPRLSASTVIVRGEHDEIVSQKWVDQLAARLPGCRVEVVPGAGHALNYNSPEPVGRVVRNLVWNNSS